jgi:hypothetical protein
VSTAANAQVREAIERATGRAVLSASPLSGGCVADVLRVDLEGGSRVVAKVAPGGGPR